MQRKPPQPCKPFTECWCEQRPNNPNCSDVGTVPINNILWIFISIIIILIIKYK